MRNNKLNVRKRDEIWETQTQPFEDVLQNICSKKFGNIHRKAPVLESLFKKVADLQACNFIIKRLRHWCFHVNIVKLKTVSFLGHLRLLLKTRGIFRILLNIYNEVFLWKWLTGKSRELFSQKSSIIDIWRGLNSLNAKVAIIEKPVNW